VQSARVQKRVSEAQKRVDNARLFDSVSLRIEYHYKNALALITSLINKAKHGRLTKALLERQTQQLKTAAQGHLGP